MSNSTLPVDLGQWINTLDTPLADLVEAVLVLAEEIQADTLAREDFWGRLFDGAAKKNALARNLCRRENAWLCGHKNQIGTLHTKVEYLQIALRAGGHI